MHRPTLDALEFHRIQEQLAGHAACKLGAELALSARPQASPAGASALQQETTEARAILDAGRTMPFGGIQDIRQAVERAAAGGVLTVEQLLAVADTIYGCRTLHRFLTAHAGAAPRLSRYAGAFGEFDELEAEIHRCIERGSVSSRASRALKEARNEIATLEGRIQDRLNSLLRQVRNHLQEALVTTRNGRYVIPVKASARAQVPGTVHGASGSGATLFIEPEAVRQMASELDTWRAIEAAEVEQVLMALSGRVAEQADQLAGTLAAVAQLDFIFARARLSQAWDAAPVRWNDEGEIDLIGARHPLLGRSAVGNRIRLNRKQRMLIVTGPNTGGKTLLLKTLGLIVAIAQTGLHIPAEEGSTLCFFDQLFADIGDQQSVEQSLSTFSGHVANVAPMLAQATPKTLVLLDELGSGTDPHEGTGLGIATLEAFLARGAYVLATTHLREIKEFGRLNPDCEIAGMGFDGESLRPTYRLVYGTLGESHGIEIAERVGMPAEVVQRARELVYGSPARTPAAPSPTSNTAVAAATPASDPTVAINTAAASASVPPVATNTAAPAASAPPVATNTAAPAASAPTIATHTAAAPTGAAPALVLAQVSPRRCRVWHEGAEREVAVADALRRQKPEGLLPGDQAILRERQVVGLRPRANALAWRDPDSMAETPLAANVSRLLILVSACRPDFHAGVLARHLLYAEYHGLEPFICLTKADQVPRGQVERWLAPFRAVGYPAAAVNLLSAEGLETMCRLLGEGVPAILASPGAGKSLLLARLGVAEPARDRRRPHEAYALRLPEASDLPDAPRLRDASHMPSAGWLIDLPSLRELGMWKPDLAGGFRDFRPFIGSCAEPGCLHREEKECGVRRAVADGRLAPERYRRYRQLLKAMGFGS